ncbi:MAG: hypothetical protein IKD79_02480, partial [Oscillospiraceae bacterium]|nr:hypothetical protein [Oscillospiraceae bacterium]
MRKGSKFLSLLFAVLLLAALCLPAAAANEPYTYTVRIFPGNNGTADTGECLVLSGIAAGTRITIGMPSSEEVTLGGTISLNDSTKYYIRGVRVSGEDTLAPLNFTVDQDMDFVVAYGMRGSAVEYTIHFVQSGNGRVLADPVTYFGSVGDRPVVAYQHIDGYRPLYYNITGTLQESGNDWTFEYEVVETGTGGTGTEGQGGTGTEGQGGTGTEGQGGTGGEGGTGTEGQGGTGGEGGTGTEGQGG